MSVIFGISKYKKQANLRVSLNVQRLKMFQVQRDVLTPAIT